MSKIYFSQIQHPVGQGGFQTGRLFHSSSHSGGGPTAKRRVSFRWAYDCGSDQISALTAQIKKFRGAKFNVLFLSHLDSDHVVGVDKLLLTASSVDELVLPYLGDDDWALHLAASVATGTLTGNFVELAADPASWLGERGVRRITYVRAGDEDDQVVDSPDQIEPFEPVVDRKLESVDRAEDRPMPSEIKWSRSPVVLHPGDKSSARAETILLSQGAEASVLVGGQRMNWILSPYAFRPPAVKMLAFRKMLHQQFGPNRTAKEYAAAARSAGGRASLRTCYDSVWKSHNLHSMALYAGPSKKGPGKVRNTAWHGKFVRRVIQPGWISTGDFDAAVQKRRDALLRHYSSFAPMVGQLVLPHHGADLSFNVALLNAFPDLACAIASVGANGHGHPGLVVQAAVAATASVDFVRVDECPRSAYEVIGPVSVRKTATKGDGGN